METRMFVISILLIVLVACSSSPVEPQGQQLPSNTPVPTQTPAPTNTPAPTATPSPEPTNTVIPSATYTPTAEPTATTPAKPEMDSDAADILYITAAVFYRTGDWIAADTIYSEMLAYRWDKAEEADLRALRSDCLIKLGEFDAAIEELLSAYELGKIDLVVLNNLCWYNGINGKPEDALGYCEQAVDVEPSAQYRDGRGLVYAQLFDVEAAIDDFQVVVDELDGATDPEMKKIHDSREAWLVSLLAGDNPITSDVLNELQRDEIQDSTPVFSPDEYGNRTRSAFQRSAQQEGFRFGNMEINDGVETVTGLLSENGCVGELILIGPEDGLTQARLQITGCDDSRLYLSWFVIQLLEDYPDVIRTFPVWVFTDVVAFIEGEVEDAITKKIGDVRFTVQNIQGEETIFEIIAEVVE
jgi:hypothetical protein